MNNKQKEVLLAIRDMANSCNDGSKCKFWLERELIHDFWGLRPYGTDAYIGSFISLLNGRTTGTSLILKNALEAIQFVREVSGKREKEITKKWFN